MSLALLVFGGGAVLAAAYFSNGAYLSKVFGLSAKAMTPARKVNDGEDYVPTDRGYLLGQHFSAIAAAGPIVGPIVAGLLFGWLPAFLWILVGSIFIGGVHDFSSLVVSVRHQARSIAEVVRLNMSRRAYFLFLSFVWISLVYVIVAFTDVTAGTFAAAGQGASVASSSLLYLALSVALGFFIRQSGMAEGRATALFLPLVLLAILAGNWFPIEMPGADLGEKARHWDYFLLAYCFIASLTPVWALLQPRGALGGYFLYATLAVAVIGLLFGGYTVQYPAFHGWDQLSKPLFPILFVTVACGACSGFHSIVSSGTTSKQLKKETDARLVGYGGMLMEGFVALVALSTVMMLAPGSDGLKAKPDQIYAQGIGSFLGLLGVPLEHAVAFGLLAFATFVYDTLDVCTRLGRYIFQEITGLKGRKGEVAATLATLLIPAFCVTLKITDAAGNAVPIWRVFWTLFGASNQLLAALALLGVTVWLRATGRPWWIAGLPMAFMMAVTLWALKVIATPFLSSLSDAAVKATPSEGVTALVLMALASLVLIEALAILSRPLKKSRA